MSDKLRESVSALMDGEADQLELRRLLSDDNRDAVDEIWSRYQLSRDAMQGNMQSSAFKQMDISSRVSDAIHRELAADAEQDVAAASTGEPWWRPAAGFAVAASVAAGMVFSVQTVNLANGVPGIEAPAGESSQSVALAASQPSLTSGRVFPVTGGGVQVASSTLQPTLAPTYRAVQPLAEQAAVSEADKAMQASRAAADLEIRKKLNSYMLRHTEQAALNNGQGMISFARVASFEEE